MRVSLICNKPERAYSLIGHLRRDGYLVDHDPAGKKVVEKAEKGLCDFFVLRMAKEDLENRIRLIEEIKKRGTTPIVIVVGENLEIEEIDRCYKAGCDDCMKWPFHPKELVLKMEKLREQNGRRARLSSAHAYDTAGKTLYVNDTPVKLTRNETLLLDLLVHNRGYTVENERIQQYLGRPMSANAIRTTVYRLREKLGIDLIVTRIGEGYRIEK